MLAKVYSAQLVGLRADIVDVEVDIAKGLHSFTIVGLPDKAVEEAKDRITAAIKNSGFKSPQKSNKKVIVSLAPADIKKEGAVFDVGIAIAYLKAGGEINFDAAGRMFVGELALDGSLRPVKGILMIVRKAKAGGSKEIYVPADNAVEAALIQGITVYGCKNLRDLTAHLSPQAREGEEIVVVKTLAPQPVTQINLRQARKFVRFFRNQRPAHRQARIRDCGGRRSQHRDVRAARHRQNHVG